MNIASTKSVIILGAGGHAKVIAETLNQSGLKVLGIVAPDIEPGKIVFGSRVLGDDDLISTYSPDDVVLANGIGALPRHNLRWRLASTMRNKGYTFITIIHPSAVIAGDVDLSEGVHVMAGSVIQPGTRIGLDSIINTGVLIDHDCRVGKNCHLAPGVVFSGGVRVDDGTHIGTGSSVIQNIFIGKNSIVAAASAIYKDVPAGVTFMQVHHPRLELIE